MEVSGGTRRYHHTMFVNAALLLALVAACGSRPAPTAPPIAAPPPEVRAPRSDTLVVARRDGVHEIDLAGRPVRRLTATPAAHPRFVPNSAALVFIATEAKQLRRIDRATGKETVLAELPRPANCPGQDPYEVEPQSHHDVWVDGGGCTANVRLMDRNENMVSASYGLRVELATGRTETRMTMSPCADIDPAPFTIATCPANAEDSRWRAAGEIADAEAHADAPRPNGFEPRWLSPSGRWLVVAGNESMGDYMHYEIALVDLETRNVYPVLGDRAEPGRGWPTALTPAQLARDANQPSVLGDVVAETRIEWLAPRDLLVIDDVLVVPGRAILDVGDIAY